MTYKTKNWKRKNNKDKKDSCIKLHAASSLTGKVSSNPLKTQRI